MRAATNPYRVDGPLREGDLAVGRQDILAWAQESLRSGETLLLVYGLPKAGKSTLLQQLRQHRPFFFRGKPGQSVGWIHAGSS